MAEEDDSDEIKELEEDVKKMADKIAEFRDTLPDHLHASLISAQRPLILHPPEEPSSTNPNPNPDLEIGTLVQEDPSHAEKIERIKQKISSNALAMSSQLQRMKDCMSRVDKLNSYNNGIHPVFKRSKITPKDCFM